MCTSHRALLGGEPVLDRCVECQRVGSVDRALQSERAMQTHEKYIAGLAALPPGVERLVRTMHYLAGVSIGRTPKTGPLRFEPVLTDFYPDLSRACPDFWPGGPGTVNLLAPPWSPLLAAAWFLRKIAETGKPPNARLKGWITTGNKWHGRHSQVAPPLPAWRLQEGSLTHASQAGRPDADRRADAYIVVADGRVMLDYNQPCLISARGLVSMGVLLWGQPRKPWEGG
ncbi:MAG TPA: hypothetical protein VH561_09265 [Micromonosporaceae bacterium]|jgi:hypothetical protein